MQEVQYQNNQKRRIKGQTDSAGYSVPGRFPAIFLLCHTNCDGSGADLLMTVMIAFQEFG